MKAAKGGGSYGSYLEPPPMRKPQKRSASLPIVRMDDLAMIVVVPWIIFTVCACMLSMLQAARLVARLIFAVVAAASCAGMVFGFIGGHGAYLAIGALSLTSSMLSAAVGHYVGVTYMNEYYQLASGSTYAEVSPLSNPSQYGDATVLSFTLDAAVSHEDTIGYMHDGKTYCTAPVLSRTQDRVGSPTAVKFWAVGLDCCGTRTGFHCDDSLDPNAHGAIVMTEPAAGYSEALRMQLPGHDLESAPGALLVHWVSDSVGFRSQLLRRSGFLLGLSSAVYLLVAISLGLVISSRLSRSTAAFCAL
mmetsp:Transcript_43707/g.79762  ORF Transcript_43707/g.79762 Transcript_43707/m.79762 type:complete len:304 (-) Transcript_43707:73-984(-)